MSKIPKFTLVESPWTEGEERFDGMLGMFQQYIKQLKYFQKKNDTTAIREDIKGYEEVLNFGSESLARKFLEVKQEGRTKGSRFRTNIDVCDYMKAHGLWG